MIAEAEDYITQHISDSHTLDFPCFKSGWVCEAELPQWAPLHIGNVTIDLSPTRSSAWDLLPRTRPTR